VCVSACVPVCVCVCVCVCVSFVCVTLEQIEHRSVCAFIRAERKLFNVEPSDVVYQGFSIAFDASVEEVCQGRLGYVCVCVCVCVSVSVCVCTYHVKTGPFSVGESRRS
jgi:hypothetical protein